VTGTPGPGQRRRCALAFDFGQRRIGVAVAEPGFGLASTLGVVAAQAGEPDWAALDRLVTEWNPATLVVGAPCEPDGSHGASAGPALAFADRMAGRYSLPVSLVDERLTSRAAEDILREQRRSGLQKRRIRGGEVDSLAARLIAETWLNSTTNMDSR
jgi:putative Holliday junction resolvase